MKTAKIIIISTVFAIAAAGCSQREIPTPNPPRQPVSAKPVITEQPLEDNDNYRRSPQQSEAPKPIAKPVMTSPAQDNISSAGEQVMLSVGYVNDRIFEYGRKLERWKELDEQSVVMNLEENQTESMLRCFRDLQRILGEYQKLHDELLQRNIISDRAMFDTEDVLDLQKRDIAFLEGECGGLLGVKQDKAAGWQEREEGADLNQVETLIERYTANEEYDEVVQVWLKIPSYQVERVDLKAKIMYGNALMHLDQPEKAAEVYKQIVDEMSVSKEQPTDLLSLRKVLADLYTASGNYQAAEEQYQQISTDYQTIGQIEQWSKLQLSILDRSRKGSPELVEYADLLRRYLAYLPERDGYEIVWKADKFLQQYPYSPVSSNVDIVKENALEQADRWFNGFFEQVDAYAEEKKFQDAMELLQTIPEAIIGPEKMQQVEEKTDELVLAEAVERETLKLERMQELQRRWNEGLLLAEEDEFDGAIQVFTELLDTEYGAKAEAKIEELSLQAAKQERRNAADLFVRFTRAGDEEGKKRLLVESRRVLKDILIKYPDVEIADKVVGNIRRVEKEMNDLDPQLLPSIEREERARALEQENAEALTPVTLDVFDMPLTPDAEAEAAEEPPVTEVESEASPRIQPLPVITPEQVQ